MMESSLPDHSTRQDVVLQPPSSPLTTEMQPPSQSSTPSSSTILDLSAARTDPDSQSATNDTPSKPVATSSLQLRSVNDHLIRAQSLIKLHKIGPYSQALSDMIKEELGQINPAVMQLYEKRHVLRLLHPTMEFNISNAASALAQLQVSLVILIYNHFCANYNRCYGRTSTRRCSTWRM
jgi:hypothetical protein